MAIDALVKPLLRLPLFQGLKPLQLTEIVRRAGRIIYKPGDILIHEGQVGDSAIVIVTGEAFRVESEGVGVPADTIIEGSMIAELAMLVETVHCATIVARTPIRALKISREDMHAQMAEDRHLAQYMTNIITERLRSLVSEINAIDGVLAALADTEAKGRDIAAPWASALPPQGVSVSVH